VPTPLRRRLIVLAAAAILPLAVLAAAGLYITIRYQDEQARRVGVELARSVANAVSTELRGSITILQTLATAPAFDRDDREAFYERAIRIVSVQHSWAAITVSDATGRVLLDTRAAAGSPVPALIDTASMNEVIESRAPVVGQLVKHQDGWLFPVRVPVERAGELRYVIAALVRPIAVRDVVTRQQIPDDWVISIVDRHGRRVARSRAHDENLGGWLSETAQALLAPGGDEGYGVSTSLEGDEIFTPYSSVQPFGWKAVLGIPTTTMRAAAARYSLLLGGGVVLSILLGTLGAGWVARGITRPIAQLRDAADALGRRELPRLPPSPLAEVRDVGDALTRAAEALARYEAERDELLEKERAARAAAEHADRAKNEFLAVLSHELRTPLNAVFGWARLLQNNLLRDEAQIARAKDAIVRNADAQVRLIDDLLDLSRISSGKMQIAMQPIRLAEVRQGALDAIRPSADEKGIRITVSADDDSATLDGDPARLQQIVWNLLANAVKFTGSGGEIHLTQQCVGERIEIIVSDTGQGIAPAMLPYVFDRFRQGDSSSTRSHGGLGLGLALVRELTTLHGGSVTATSLGVGCGSTFTVSLPRAADTSALSPVPHTDLAADALLNVTRLDGVRILVADDEADALALAETILSSAGAEVRSASSAARAFELIRDFKPHVLVSDLEMPDEDGYALVRRLRALGVADGGAIPAIALSAYGRPQDRTSALAAGFTMHVPKPVDPGELTAIVANVSAGAATLPRPGYGKMPISM
jgi:signal transduction histidine kinase/ActR/RegA family two-component response regulator